MLTRRPDGNISGEATTVSGNIFLEAMRTAKADLIIIDDFGLAPLPDAILDRLIHASRMKPAVSSLRMTSVCRGAI